MIEVESLPMKFKSAADAVKRFIRKVSEQGAKACQGAVHVTRVMIFLHSAKDFPSILKLYGMENSEDRMKDGAPRRAAFFMKE